MEVYLVKGHTQSLFQEAHSAEATGVQDLATHTSCPGNSLRNLQRRLVKGSKWPPPMEVQVPLENLKTHAVYEQTLYMMMPHEILHAVMGRNKFAGNTPFCFQGLNGLTKHLFEANCQRFNLAKEKCIPLGLWIDGVPVKWDRSESLTVVSLNCPGQVDPTFKRLRIPLTVLNKKFCTPASLDKVLEYISWSLALLIQDAFPSSGPNGEAITGPPWRKKRIGQPLGCYAILAEIRGDWECYKNVFGLQGWQDKYCCFRCFATKDSIKDAALIAEWRSQRRHFFDHLQQAKHISGVFKTPGISLWTFQIDWLHVVDLGVAADFAGNLMRHVLDRFPGDTPKQQRHPMHRVAL